MATNAVQSAQLASAKLSDSRASLRKAHGSLENAWKWLSAAHITAEEAKLPLYVAAGLVQEGQGEGHRLGLAVTRADMLIKELQVAVRNLQEEVKYIESGEHGIHDDLLKWIERLAS